MCSTDRRRASWRSSSGALRTTPIRIRARCLILKPTVLRTGAPEAPEPHRIAAATIASGEMELERRWQLARDINGRPVLWIQRQRKVLWRMHSGYAAYYFALVRYIVEPSAPLHLAQGQYQVQVTARLLGRCFPRRPVRSYPIRVRQP